MTKLEQLVEFKEFVEELLQNMNEDKLTLVENIIENLDDDVDASQYIEYVSKIVENLSDDEAEVILENVDDMSVIADKIVESVAKNINNEEAIINEAREMIMDIDVNDDLLNENEEEEIEETEELELPILPVLISVLSEMLGEEVVEELPLNMVLDIYEELKDVEIDIDEDATILEKISAIKEALEEAIENKEIDLDTDDYDGETVGEFLEQFENIDEMVESILNDDVILESEEDYYKDVLKESVSNVLTEKRVRCHDVKCYKEKAMKAKKYFMKHEMHGGVDIESIDPKKLKGRLAKYVKLAINNAKKRGVKYPPEYIKYVLIPGIIKRMRFKNRHMNNKAKKLKPGMTA
jgi:hypothetical protein